MTPVPLTKRQREILDFYLAFRRQHNLSPTLDEIARHFGVNRVTIFGHVAELERKGVLTRAGKNISRGMAPADSAESDSGADGRSRLCLHGTIAAGRPIEALENPEPVDLSALLNSASDHFALRVKGDSMIEDAICDGDLVIVEPRSHAVDGEIVVAILPGEEATLKRIYRESGGYRLQPANAALRPIHTNQLEIRGVVIAVLRNLR